MKSKFYKSFVITLLLITNLMINKNSTAQWAQSGIYGGRVFCFERLGTNILAGTGAGVFISSDNGSNWSRANNGFDQQVYSLAVSGNSIFGCDGSNVYRTTNNGINWTPMTNGL